nr:sigma-54-dependent Fis family transcriptional regulator [Desulfobulbaceae bacterium]
MSSILIIDDDQALCRSLEIQLEMEGHTTKSALNSKAGLELISATKPDLILLDINLPDKSGIETLPKILSFESPPSVIIMTGDPDNKRVIEAMRAGATDYLRKPFDFEKVLSFIKKIEKINSHKTFSIDNKQANEIDRVRHEIIGSHSSIVELHKIIGLLSRSRISVLILGESGTGKELTARILHNVSSENKPFVAINCSAIVPTLMESEFFGHEKGSFTGADSRKIGKLEHAEDGTVFLDEIGDMPLELQAKLLRVLQEDEFVRVGGHETIPLKARVIAATHADLPALIRKGQFRQDLFFRLTVSTVTLPPLRERGDDIYDLTTFLLQKISKKLSCPPVTIDKKAIDLFKKHIWTGNIRELENTLTRAVALTQGSVLTPEDFDFHHWQITNDFNPEKQRPVTLADAEKMHIEMTLNENDWNISRSARLLDISPTTLRKKISDFNLEKV